MATIPARLVEAAEPRLKVYTPTPTIARCMHSDKLFRILISARGEGKSTGSLMTIVTHARKQPREHWPMRVAALRDTRRNLGLTTAATIREWFPPHLASYWVGKELEPEHCILKLDPKGPPLVEFFFFGMDSPGDYSKFQSFEASAVWLEEPAPAADISGGVSGDALAVAITSLRKSVYPLVMISMNPPDGEDWVSQTWGLPGAIEPDWDEERRAAVQDIRAQSDVFFIPSGENTYLDVKSPGYRERNKAMLLALGRSDLVARLVEGKVGNVQVGAPVASSFVEDQHVVDEVAPIAPGTRLIASWDPRHSPACVLWRVRPGMTADVVAAFQVINGGVKQLIQQQILPWLALYAHDDCTFVHTGDPTTTNEDQSDSAMSAARVIIALLGGEQWVPGPVSIEDRRLPLHDCLNRYMNGRPWIRISRRHAKPLVQALVSGWHYKKDPSGRVISETWVKNQASDLGEAFAYGCALLARREAATSAQEAWRRKVSQMAKDRRLTVVRGTGA